MTPTPAEIRAVREMQLALRAELDQLQAENNHWHSIVVHTFAYLQELRDAGKLQDTALLAELGRALQIDDKDIGA